MNTYKVESTTQPKFAITTNYPLPAPQDASLEEYYDYFVQRMMPEGVIDPVEQVLTPWIHTLFHGDPKQGLIVSGPSRSGKTYFARFIQEKLRRKGFPVESYSGRHPQELRWIFDRRGKNFPESLLITRGIKLIVIDDMKIENIMHTFPIWEVNPRLLVLTHSPIDLECISASITDRFRIVTIPVVRRGKAIKTDMLSGLQKGERA